MQMISPAKTVKILINGIKFRKFAALHKMLDVLIVLEQINGTLFKKYVA